MIAAEAPPSAGARIALEQCLSSSSVAEVHRGRDRVSGARVVLKQAKASHSEALRAEHALLARLRAAAGDAVPEIVADGVSDEIPWFAAAYVEGETLRAVRDRLWDGRSAGSSRMVAERAALARDTALAIALAFATTLARVHAAGVVHGDLSLDNVLWTPAGQVVLIDFDAASTMFPEPGPRRRVTARATPGYAAPEALLGEALDTRADLYSWACIVRELLLGEPVFSGATPVALARLHLDARPRPAVELDANIPVWLDALLLGLLEKEPRRRRSTACAIAWTLAKETRQAGAWDASSPPRPPPHRPGFVGRHAELHRIEERLAAAARGAGGILIVSGKGGVGKSTLLAEGARRAQARGFCVIQAGRQLASREAAPGLDAEPLLARLLLDPALPHLTSGAATMAPEVLAGLMPVAAASLARLGVSLAAPDDAVLGVVQRRALRALVELMRALGAARPLAIVLDDLQDADDLSRGLLQSSEASALGEARVLLLAVVGQARVEALGDSIERVELTGLDRGSTAQLVDTMLGTEGDGAALGTFLHERCEGNPLLVSEAVRLAIVRGALDYRPERGWSLPAPSAFEALHVDTLEGTLEARLSLLSPAALALAGAAAVLGMSCLSSELQALSSTSSAELAAAASELAQHELLGPIALGFAFAHEHVRRACERRLPEDDRRALHAARARQLGEAEPLDARRMRQVGEHWLRAGRIDRAGPLLVEAAKQLEAGFQPLAAIACLRLLCDAQRSGRPPGTPFDAAELAAAERPLLLYGRTGQHAQLRSLASELLAAPDADPRSRCRVLLALARSLRVTGDYAAATLQLDHTERCLNRSSRRGRDERLWLELQGERVWLLYMTREVHAIGPALQRMAPVVRSHGTPAQQASFYMLSANDLVLRNRYQYSPTAVAQERYGLALLTAPDALPQLAMMEFDLAFLLLLGEVSHCSEATVHLERARALAERLEDSVLAARVTTYSAIAERRLGRVDACEDAARRALEQARLTGTRGYAGAALACLGWVAWRRDDVAAALSSFAEAEQAWWHRRQGGARSRQVLPFQWRAQLPRLASHASRDDVARARSALDELLAETQQRLPRALDEPLEAVQRDWEQASARDLDRAISEIVRCAAGLGYL